MPSFVMKCGGSTLAALPDLFFEELKQLQSDGIVPVIVHGGGPAISATLEKLEIPTQFVNGLRKTSEEVLDVVEMVLSGQINKQIVRKLNQAGAHAIGLSGIDGNLIEAQPVEGHEEIGFVGDVTQVRADLIEGIIGLGAIPVIAPLGIDAKGQRYNINADTSAGAVAASLGVEHLIVVTDVPGMMKTVNGEKVILPATTEAEIQEMIQSGEIYGGMIPKVKAALKCLQGGVSEVVIVSGTKPGVLGRVLRGEAEGTRIRKSQ
ncbi:acetylglutamate kinase [Marinicrinis lubricantis]|uniref:Acetylglutamate kinase n=1 Tax=Marinicrinis lubricantis TaxID=2086470 RepID=A0ABW1ITT1_9BACL